MQAGTSACWDADARFLCSSGQELTMLSNAMPAREGSSVGGLLGWSLPEAVSTGLVYSFELLLTV